MIDVGPGIIDLCPEMIDFGPGIVDFWSWNNRFVF